MTSLDLARHFAACFEQAKELAKEQPAEVAALMEAVAAHLRSAAPLSLLAAPELQPSQDALIDLGEGRIVRLRVLDGRLNMYVCEGPAHDASVALSEVAREQLRAALGSVR
jgi:hypothetical protein